MSPDEVVDSDGDTNREADESVFFDTVQSHSEIPDSFSYLPDTSQGSTVCNHRQMIRVIDERCPMWIDIAEKKGKYERVFVLKSDQANGRSVLQNWEDCCKTLGIMIERENESSIFSQRLAGEERARRLIGLAVARKEGEAESDLPNIFNDASPMDEIFFRRFSIKNVKHETALAVNIVGRALSDRHWRQELAAVHAKHIAFYHPGRTKPIFTVDFKSIVRLGPLGPEDSPLLPRYHFLSIETYGRTIYLMFLKEGSRDKWKNALAGRLIDCSNSVSMSMSSTDSSFQLIEVDDPTSEFLHKSDMWDYKKRRILNCRKFSFQTPPAQAVPDPEVLVSNALRRATSLDPKDSNSVDLQKFMNATADLKTAHLHELGETQKKAFFLNLYHVMVMHAFLVLGPPDSSFKWISYFNNIAYQVSDDIFSIAELEHNIIRAEMNFPSSFFSRLVLPKSHYNFALSQPDFRINFALNCGSVSNPTTQVPIYRSNTIEDQLDDTSRQFIGDTALVSASRNGISITLPRICQWFKEDFGGGDGSSAIDMLKRIEPYFTKEQQTIFQSYQQNNTGGYAPSLKYHPYDFQCQYLTLSTTTKEDAETTSTPFTIE